MRARALHRSYCYVCRSSVNKHIGLLLLRRASGFARRYGLCYGCLDWLMGVCEVARGAKIDWSRDEAD
jgi:hypothetical protein